MIWIRRRVIWICTYPIWNQTMNHHENHELHYGLLLQKQRPIFSSSCLLAIMRKKQQNKTKDFLTKTKPIICIHNLTEHFCKSSQNVSWASINCTTKLVHAFECLVGKCTFFSFTLFGFCCSLKRIHFEEFQAFYY